MVAAARAAAEQSVVARYAFSAEERAELERLLDELAGLFDSAEDPEFLDLAQAYAHELPRSLRVFLNEFRLAEREPACVISGYEIDDGRLGPTPRHWRERCVPSPALREELLLVLYGSLLGDVFGWETQQDGTIVHSVLPVRSDEFEQLGSGSRELLWWHTEDAFHPLRADYLALFCLRNPDAVATTISTAQGLDASDDELDVLFDERFSIRPDNSHLARNNADGDFSAIEEMLNKPGRIAVLHGGRDRPYLRLDPYFMDPLDDDPEAQKALDHLVRTIDENVSEVPLGPGECLVLDNFRAVHGRVPFVARYDGNDRWLKRVNVARDIRKSRASRGSAENRIVR
jgi:Fe(II)/alpha-ketoglutarate-dependent arginine beta-hydroxylase